MANYIGIDLGGTNVRVILIDEDNNILAERLSPSYAQEGREYVLNNLYQMIESIDGYDQAKGIGIGAPGPIVDGVMQISTNLIGFKEFPLAKTFEERYHIPTFVDNDANVAGLAEALIGAGKNHHIVYYFTHSTGIGGVLVIDGKILSGRHGYAGEIANIIVDRNGDTFNCLNKGAVENLASGTAIGKEGVKYNIGSCAKDVFDQARLGDEKSLMIVDKMVEDMAIMMSAIAHVCDPDCFVIGGGCSKASDVYFDKLKKSYYDKVHVGMRDIEILNTEIKEPGALGAALLCKSLLK